MASKGLACGRTRAVYKPEDARLQRFAALRFLPENTGLHSARVRPTGTVRQAVQMAPSSGGDPHDGEFRSACLLRRIFLPAQSESA